MLVGIKLAGIVLAFDPAGLQAFDLSKSLFSRATEWFLVALLLLIAVRYGVAVLPRSRLHFVALAVLAANAAAAVFAENRYLALHGDRSRYLGLTFYLDMLVLYLAACVAFRSRRDWLVAGAIFAGAAIGSIGYALAQRLELDPVPWVQSGRVRPFGTFGNPDMFGHFLSLS